MGYKLFQNCLNHYNLFYKNIDLKSGRIKYTREVQNLASRFIWLL